MSLATMDPNPVWSADAHEEAVETLAELAETDATIHVWGADWCGDCRSALPDLAAAIEAAEIEGERVHHHEVDREKQGDLVEDYDVESIPTVVIEENGEELARFVESEPVPAVVHLAEQLDAQRRDGT